MANCGSGLAAVDSCTCHQLWLRCPIHASSLCECGCGGCLSYPQSSWDTSGCVSIGLPMTLHALCECVFIWTHKFALPHADRMDLHPLASSCWERGREN